MKKYQDSATQKLGRILMVVSADTGKCLRCGGCVGVCPVAALHLSEHGISCSAKCTSCSACVQFCPVGALSLVKK